MLYRISVSGLLCGTKTMNRFIEVWTDITRIDANYFRTHNGRRMNWGLNDFLFEKSLCQWVSSRDSLVSKLEIPAISITQILWIRILKKLYQSLTPIVMTSTYNKPQKEFSIRNIKSFEQKVDCICVKDEISTTGIFVGFVGLILILGLWTSTFLSIRIRFARTEPRKHQ